MIHATLDPRDPRDPKTLGSCSDLRKCTLIHVIQAIRDPNQHPETHHPRSQRYPQADLLAGNGLIQTLGSCSDLRKRAVIHVIQKRKPLQHNVIHGSPPYGGWVPAGSPRHHPRGKGGPRQAGSAHIQAPRTSPISPRKLRPMHVDVIGLPAPQGSKRHVGNGIMIESSKKVKPWRQDVKYAVLEIIGAQPPIPGPVDITVTFYLPRPKGHYGTGRNHGLLRVNAPFAPAGKPDLDKLLRSTFDALGEAGVFIDDAQVVDVVMRKRFADGRPPGAVIDVQALDTQPALLAGESYAHGAAPGHLGAANSSEVLL